MATRTTQAKYSCTHAATTFAFSSVWFFFYELQYSVNLHGGDGHAQHPGVVLTRPQVGPGNNDNNNKKVKKLLTLLCAWYHGVRLHCVMPIFYENHYNFFL